MQHNNNTDDERSTTRGQSCRGGRPSARQRRGPPVPIVPTPREEDVLCGKEKHCIIHPGTRNYRRFIDAYQPRYRAANSKQNRMEITKEIVLTIGQNARFLRYNKELNAYEELSHLEARDKTSHALRTACKRISKHQKKIPAATTSATKSAIKPASVPSAPLIVSSSTAQEDTTPLQWQLPQSNERFQPPRFQPPRFPGRVTVDHHHPLPIHSETRMDGALFDDLMTLLKDPEPLIKESE